ncbi:MAG: hypothetical protein JWR64_1348, partial [Marmoricola sp.]|nr:hypothetical protein [Marmoricola sp.]
MTDATDTSTENLPESSSESHDPAVP